MGSPPLTRFANTPSSSNPPPQSPSTSNNTRQPNSLYTSPSSPTRYFRATMSVSPQHQRSSPRLATSSSQICLVSPAPAKRHGTSSTSGPRRPSPCEPDSTRNARTGTRPRRQRTRHHPALRDPHSCVGWPSRGSPGIALSMVDREGKRPRRHLLVERYLRAAPPALSRRPQRVHHRQSRPRSRRRT